MTSCGQSSDPNDQDCSIAYADSEAASLQGSPPRYDCYGFLVEGDSNTTSAAGEKKGREGKWLDMLRRWNYFASKKQRKIRSRCRKGIPHCLRGEAWFYLSGGYKLLENNFNYYSHLLARRPEKKWVDLINKDITRTFPNHELFNHLKGQEQLYNVLCAYSIHNPIIGYCQSLTPITSVLLMFMPEEQAFWVLVRLCDRYMVEYHVEGMRGIQIDALIVEELVKNHLPRCHNMLSNAGVDAILYVQDWFFCIFSRSLPWPTVLRIWDIYFFEGKRVLFRVALVLIKHSLASLPDNADFYSLLQALKNPPEEVMVDKFLIAESLFYSVGNKDLEKLQKVSLNQYERRQQAQQANKRPGLSLPNGKDVESCSRHATVDSNEKFSLSSAPPSANIDEVFLDSTPFTDTPSSNT